jgi:hypothetical protein
MNQIVNEDSLFHKVLSCFEGGRTGKARSAQCEGHISHRHLALIKDSSLLEEAKFNPKEEEIYG